MAEQYSGLSDSALLELTAKKDTMAFEELYDRYAPLVYKLISKITEENEKESAILTEESFLIAYKYAHRYNPGTENAYTWLVYIARNKAVDSMRRKRDIPGMPSYTQSYEEKIILPHLSRVIDPLDFSIAMSVKDTIENALNQLAEPQQLAIFLSFYLGLTPEEISEEMNIPVKTAAVKLQNALTNLRDTLLRGDN